MSRARGAVFALAAVLACAGCTSTTAPSTLTVAMTGQYQAVGGTNDPPCTASAQVRVTNSGGAAVFNVRVHATACGATGSTAIGDMAAGQSALVWVTVQACADQSCTWSFTLVHD